MSFLEYKKGDRIDSVEVLEIKEGGLGRLYIGYCRDRQIKVAIKTIRREIWEENGLEARWREIRDSAGEGLGGIDLGKYIYHIFIREARLICQAQNHPNVIRGTRLWYSETGQPFFECEFVADSEDLAELNRRLRAEADRPLSCLEAMHIAISFCNGMIYISDKMLEDYNRLHRENPAQGFVHRDIKPENILLNRNNQLKIIDLGLAKYILTRTPTSFFNRPIAVGSFRYISPEQRENYDAVLPSSDIYSFGVVLYELLGGVMPYSPGGRVVLPEYVPEGLRAIVARCLERESGRRFQRFQELKEALAKLVAEIKAGRVLLHERYRCEKCGYVSGCQEVTDTRASVPQVLEAMEAKPSEDKGVLDKIAELLGGSPSAVLETEPPADQGADLLGALERLIQQRPDAATAPPAPPAPAREALWVDEEVLQGMRDLMGASAQESGRDDQRKPERRILPHRERAGMCPLCNGSLIEFAPGELKVPEKSIYTWDGFFDIE